MQQQQQAPVHTPPQPPQHPEPPPAHTKSHHQGAAGSSSQQQQQQLPMHLFSPGQQMSPNQAALFQSQLAQLQQQSAQANGPAVSVCQPAP